MTSFLLADVIMDLNRHFGKQSIMELITLLQRGLVDESSLGRETTALAVDAAENRVQTRDVAGPSSMPESSRRPGKEPMGIEDVEGRDGTLPDHEENGQELTLMPRLLDAQDSLENFLACEVKCSKVRDISDKLRQVVQNISSHIYRQLAVFQRGTTWRQFFVDGLR
ncbi:uncharacterized protein A4U43_C03F6300 [Asparagus officinalis]|uniref:Uncharacterized protein n=1 Tax=Asparagus officinalis TaxID=4686 RepID=A0A5P1F9M8_ASPOF|nr:uncharacterized protein A4U43_C03F6300 [Asparagus officinalis]